MFTIWRRRVRWRSALVATAVLAAGIVVAPTTAQAVVSATFELEGNIFDDTASAPPDWGTSGGTNSIFTVSNGVGVERNPLPANFLSAGFVRDFTPSSSADSSTFTSGSKDTLNISTGWRCVGANNVTDKGDIQNAYAAAYFDPSTHHLILYFGMEKNAPNGNNDMGVWFLRDGTVGCNNPSPGGGGLAFSGNHQDGDILLVAAFTGGGSNPTVSAYQWDGGAGGSLNQTALATGGACGTASGNDLCAITNDTASVTTPWQTQDKNSATPQNKTGLGTTLGADQFFEGAIDLTAYGLDRDDNGNTICINRFVFNTRASQQLGASLYDFAAGNVETCGAPSITTELFTASGTSLASPDNTVTLPADVYDTAAISGAIGTPTGTVTYSLWTNDTCTMAATSPSFPSGGNTATVQIGPDGTIPPSPTLTFATPGTFYWRATYSGGGRNAGATSECTSEPLVVQKPQPQIATTPSPTTLAIGSGGTFNDTATISDGYFPSGGIAPGNVTFTLYGPFATAAAITCTTAVFTTTVAAVRTSDSTATATSASYTPTQVGVYQWVASYAGNTQNLPVATGCDDTGEQVTVTPATPSIATKILLSDRARVSTVPGAGSPTGSVLFQLYPSADCSGTAVASETVTLGADGTATTTTPVAVNAGTYSWKVTFTSTNPNYNGAATTCTQAQSDEQATIGYAGTSPIS